MVDNKFIVNCIRPSSRAKKYDLHFDYNKEMIDCIKLLDSKNRSYKDKIWSLNVKGIFELISMFRGSDKVYFDFGSQEEKERIKEQFDKVIEDKKEYKRKVAELTKNKEFWLEMKEEYAKNYKTYSEKAHSGLLDGIILYPHQIVAALFLDATKSALLSMEMGTGKSLSSIAYVEMNDFNKVFVVTPNSLKFNYYGEVEKFTNAKAHIVNWKKNRYTIDESKYIIVNYEFFNPSDDKKMLKKISDLNVGKIDCVIADESHRLKNQSSNTYKNFSKIFNKKIFKGEPSKVFLTGTPAPNRAFELYTVLNQISPIDFATKTHFYEYYCGMKYDPYGFGYNTDINSQNLEELYYKIAPYTYRVKKEDVLDLPEKIYQKIMLEMTPAELKMYKEIEKGAANELFSETENPLTILVRLRQYTSELKINRSIEIIENILQEGGKIVIIDQFKSILRELHKKYPNNSVLHTGDEPKVEVRAEMVSRFQDPESPIKIFLGSVATCNYGLTLTAADKMILLTLPYVVGEYDQVSDRIHRIGQKNTVYIYPFIFIDTIDELVFQILESKRKEIRKVIDNEDYTSNVEESVISEVVKKIKEKHG
jgi:SNF2 family DNA or RNA helicase